MQIDHVRPIHTPTGCLNYVKIQTIYRRTCGTTMTSIDRTVKMEQAIL